MKYALDEKCYYEEYEIRSKRMKYASNEKYYSEK